MKQEMPVQFSSEQREQFDKIRKETESLREKDDKYTDSVKELAFFENDIRDEQKKKMIRMFPQIDPEEKGISEIEKEERQKKLAEYLNEIGDKFSDVKFLEMKAQQVKWVDDLTGLRNKNAFLKDISRIINLEKRQKKDCAIIIIDFDEFKSINDTFGHDAGDEAIKALAKILSNNLRPSDFIYRFGGDEFVVVSPHANIKQSIILAERIRKKVEEAVIEVVDSNQNKQQLKRTVSIGCMSMNKVPGIKSSLEENIDGELLEEFFVKADIALYESKKLGRNRVTAYGNHAK